MTVTHVVWPYVLVVVLIVASLRLLVERVSRRTQHRARSPTLYRPDVDFDYDLTADERAAEFDRVTDRYLHDAAGQPEPD